MTEAHMVLVTSQNEETTLLGKTKKDYAIILKWMSFFNSEIIIPLVEVYLPLVGIRPYNKETVDMFANMAQAAVDVVEEHLDGKPFLVGEEITLADLFCAGLISIGFMFFYDKAWHQANPNVSRWYERITNQPIYTAVTEKIEFLDEPKLINAPPKHVETEPVPETPN